MLWVTVQPHLPELDPISGSLRAAWSQLLDHPPVDRPVPDWAKESFPRVAEAAARAGLHPSQLEDEGFVGSRFAELAAGQDWAYATCCKYAKAGWAHGLALPRLPTPEPQGGPDALPELYLVDDGSPPRVVRAAVWCRLAAVWPAPLPLWSELRREHLQVNGNDAVLLVPQQIIEPAPDQADGTWAQALQASPGAPLRAIVAPGAGPLVSGWLNWRQRLPGEAVLCTLRAGPGTAAGAPLAERSLEVTFRGQAVRALALAGELGTRHGDERRLARRATYETLTYDTYRRLLLQAGATPVDPHSRGAVRATR